MVRFAGRFFKYCSHQRLQMMAKKDGHNKEHFGKTEAMSQAKDSFATEEGITQSTPKWWNTKFQTAEEKGQRIRRWFVYAKACRKKRQALTKVLPLLHKLSRVKILSKPAAQRKLMARRGALEDQIFGLTIAVAGYFLPWKYPSWLFLFFIVSSIPWWKLSMS